MAKAGRPRGSTNKPYRRVLDEYLERKYKGEFNPVINAIEGALKMQEIADTTGEISDYKTATEAFIKVSDFIQPRLKAVEHSGDNSLTVSIQRKRFTKENDE
jgi:hypothetical protein